MDIQPSALYMKRNPGQSWIISIHICVRVDVEFSLDGSQMAVMGNSSYSIWGTPDETLKAGFEVVKQFQEALSTGDYEQSSFIIFHN